MTHIRVEPYIHIKDNIRLIYNSTLAFITGMGLADYTGDYHCTLPGAGLHGPQHGHEAWLSWGPESSSLPVLNLPLGVTLLCS